jgi:glycosyltransferase involved in cell wall biosynthesis
LAEGFGLPLAEAMACGTPVVTSNRSSLKEVTGDAAVLVDPDDPPAIAAGVVRILRNSDLRRDLVERGLARCKKYSRRRVIPSVLDLYRGLCETASSTGSVAGST